MEGREHGIRGSPPRPEPTGRALNLDSGHMSQFPGGHIVLATKLANCRDPAQVAVSLHMMSHDVT